MKNIYPLSYSIPLEKISNLKHVSEKKRELSLVIPGKPGIYNVSYNSEKEYYKQYEESKYAITKKKGGWDALRHYEILANNCLPLFEDLENCPSTTLFNFPKEKLIYVKENWKKISDEEYTSIVEYIHEYVKSNMSCEASAKYLLSTIGVTDFKQPKVLMINNNFMKKKSWANYSQYLITIGLRNVLHEKFVDYPKIEKLYKTYEGKPGYGRGFTYSKLLDDLDIDRDNIEEKIKNKEFDYIIYGLMGKDESNFGDIRLKCPFWEIVKEKYDSNHIVFIYGGDKVHSKDNEKNYEHLKYHSDYGMCFVRELDI
jgi:hypothetical protein